MRRATLSRSDTRHDLGAILNHLARVEAAFPTRKPLHDDARFFADEYAHRAPPASATTFSAPSLISLAIVSPRPESRKISCPFSTFVPSMRTTTGSFRFRSLAAATTPDA